MVLGSSYCYWLFSDMTHDYGHVVMDLAHE